MILIWGRSQLILPRICGIGIARIILLGIEKYKDYAICESMFMWLPVRRLTVFNNQCTPVSSLFAQQQSQISASFAPVFLPSDYPFVALHPRVERLVSRAAMVSPFCSKKGSLEQKTGRSKCPQMQEPTVRTRCQRIMRSTRCRH